MVDSQQSPCCFLSTHFYIIEGFESNCGHQLNFIKLGICFMELRELSMQLADSSLGFVDVFDVVGGTGVRFENYLEIHIRIEH